MCRAIILGVSISLLAINLAHSNTIYVPDDFPSIQGAVNAAVNGDTIIVRPGTYTINISCEIFKEITIKSEKGPAVTVLDGQQGHIRYRYNVSNTVLYGFTLRDAAIAIWCDEGSTPLIKNNIFYNNIKAIFTIYGGSPTITGNVFFDNGTYNGSNGDCAISINGGGDSFTTISNNIMFDNFTRVGGAIYVACSGQMTITNNVFFNNSASKKGGGIYLGGGGNYILKNNILWNNDSPSGKEIFVKNSSTLTINHSDVEEGLASVYVESGSTLNWGSGMINADPLFVDSANDDFHLTWDSPCKDTGDNTAVTELFDFEGDPRICNGTVDMGADEFYYHLYHIGDVVPGSNIDMKVVGPPGVSPVRLALGSGIQDPPLPTPYGDLYLKLPPYFMTDLGTIPSDGVLKCPAAVPAFWNPRDEKPLQTLVGPLGNPNSVLTNLMLLNVE